MSFICVVPVSPMRAMPSHRSEIVSQLLFGEILEIIEVGKDGWVKITCEYDLYEGWVTANHLDEAEIYTETTFAKKWTNIILQNGQPMQLPFGSVLPNEICFKTSLFEFNSRDIKKETPQIFEVNHFFETAMLFLNTAYLWGGKSVFGIDCSGYVQQVYKCFGIKLQRDAYQQAEQGEAIGFLQEAKLGDLAFFDNEEGRITHVGIMLNDHQIIHSSGKVRIDDIDNQGIINGDTGLRTHQLRIIKRYV